MKIKDVAHLIEGMKSECVKINGSVGLLHHIHVNLVKIIKLCITNDGNHGEDVIY